MNLEPLKLTIKYNEFMFCTSKFKAEAQVEKFPYNCLQFPSIRFPIRVKVGVTSPAEEYVTAPFMAPEMWVSVILCRASRSGIY